MAMDDERIARAINYLGEAADLFSSDATGLLDLIEDYFDPDNQPGNSLSYTNLINLHSAIVQSVYSYMYHNTAIVQSVYSCILVPQY